MSLNTSIALFKFTNDASDLVQPGHIAVGTWSNAIQADTGLGIQIYTPGSDVVSLEVQGSNFSQGDSPLPDSAWKSIATVFSTDDKPTLQNNFTRIRIRANGDCSVAISAVDAVSVTGSSGGVGPIIIADGADSATGFKADPTYSDNAGGASGSVIALLKGVFVKLHAIFSRQAEVKPFTPVIGVDAAITLNVSTVAAVTAIPSNTTQLLLVAETVTVGIAFLSSSNPASILFTKCLRVPIGDAGVTFGIPVGATHIGYVTASGTAKLIVAGGVGS